MDNVFVRAMFCEGPVIAGVRLQSFAPHHALALMMYDNPFMQNPPSRIPEAKDAVQAILVCRDTYSRRLSSVTKWRDSRILQQWWVAKAALIGEPYLVTRVAEYMTNDGAAPEVAVSDPVEGAKESGVVWPVRLVLGAVAASKGGLSWDEAWATPCNVLNIICATHAEMSGTATVLDQIVERMEKSWAELSDETIAKMKEAVSK